MTCGIPPRKGDGGGRELQLGQRQRAERGAMGPQTRFSVEPCRPVEINGVNKPARRESKGHQRGTARAAPQPRKAALAVARYSLNTTGVADSGSAGDRSTRRPLASERSAKTAARTKTLVSPWVKTISACIAGAALTSS